MAEQVEITNVGNNGVASEATLKLLLAAMEKMAKAKGMDPTTTVDKVKKTRQEELRAIINGTNETEKNTDAKKENTKAVEDSTSGLKKFSYSILDASLYITGMLTASLVGLTKEMFNSGYSLQEFTQHIPLLGNYFNGLAGYLDNSAESLRSLTSTGGTFNNSLVLLRLSATESHMALNEYTDMIRRNSERLSSFGGTVTQGALSTKNMFKELGNTQLELMNMGLSVADINEGLINYQYLTRAGSRAQSRDIAAQSQAAAEYIKQITKLSKLTGQDAASMQEKLSAQQADVAFQMKLAKLRPEEQQKVQQGLAEALAMAGETGALFFKQQFLGMPPLTRSTQMFAATMGESAKVISDMANQASSASVSFDQFNSGSMDRFASFMEGSAAAGMRLEDALAAASGGLDGPVAEIAELFKQQGKQMTDYLDINGVFQREKFEQDYMAAQNELNQRNKVDTALNEFQNSINNLKTTIFSTLIDTGVFETIGKGIEAFSKAISVIFSPERIEIIGKFFTSINTALDNFTTNFSSENIIGAIGTLIGDIGSAIITGIANLWADSKVITAIVVGIGAVFAAVKLKQAISGIMDFIGLGNNNNNGNQDGGNGIGNTLKGIGSGIAGIGRGIGTGIKATLVGIAKGIAAFGKADVLKGIAVITVGMVGVSAGLGAVSMAIKQFQGIEWEDMYKAGAALLAVAAPIGIMSGILAKVPSSAIKGAAILAGSMTLLSGAAGAVAMASKQFKEVEWEDMAKFGSVVGAIVGLAVPLVGFANAIAAIPVGMLKGAAILGGSMLILGVAVAGVAALVGLTLPLVADGMKSFESLDGKKLTEVGQGMKQVGYGLLAIGGGDISYAVGRFVGWIGELFGSEDPIDRLKRFGELAEPLSSAGPALENFGNSYLRALAFLEKAKLGKNFEDTIEKLKPVLSLDFRTTTYQKPPIIDHIFDLSEGLGSLSNTVLPANTSLVELKQNLESIRTVSGLNENIETFNTSLDFSSVDSYTKAIENLKEALSDLNDELAESNDGILSSNLSAGELLQDVSINNKLASDKLETLNTTMIEILKILNQNIEIETKIEKNTRYIGSDISRGSISNIR